MMLSYKFLDLIVSNRID